MNKDIINEVISKIKSKHIIIGAIILFLFNLSLTIFIIKDWGLFSSNTLAIISLMSILIVVVQMNMQNSLRNKELVAEQTQRKEDIKRIDEQRREDLYYQTRPYIQIELEHSTYTVLKLTNIGLGIAEHIFGYAISNNVIYPIQLDIAKIKNTSYTQYHCISNVGLTLPVNEMVLFAPLSYKDTENLCDVGGELFLRCLNENGDIFNPNLESFNFPWKLYILYSGITKYKIEIIEITFDGEQAKIISFSCDYTPKEKYDNKDINELISNYKKTLI